MLPAPAPLQHRVAARGTACRRSRVRYLPVYPLLICEMLGALLWRHRVQPVEIIPGGTVVVILRGLAGRFAALYGFVAHPHTLASTPGLDAATPCGMRRSARRTEAWVSEIVLATTATRLTPPAAATDSE